MMKIQVKYHEVVQTSNAWLTTENEMKSQSLQQQEKVKSQFTSVTEQKKSNNKATQKRNSRKYN